MAILVYLIVIQVSLFKAVGRLTIFEVLVLLLKKDYLLFLF